MLRILKVPIVGNDWYIRYNRYKPMIQCHLTNREENPTIILYPIVEYKKWIPKLYLHIVQTLHNCLKQKIGIKK